MSARRVVKEVAESTDPFVPSAVKLLETIPGIGRRVAEVIVSEIGVDTGALPDGWASGKLGGGVSGQQRIRWQATLRADDEG